MYRAKINQASILAQRARARAFPALLVLSTTIAVVGVGALNKVAHCQHDPSLQAEAEDLKERVQEFTEHVLELADSPSSSLSGTSRHDHGHGSPFFSSAGDRRVEPRHAGLNFSGTTSPSYDEYSGHTRMERFRGAYVDKNEELVPAVLYISGAAVIGSFLARHSNFVVRFLSPVALALGAGAYTIPKTTNNVIYGLKHYDYREWNREWQNKWYNARQSVTDATHSIQTGLRSVATDAKDAAHEVSEKSHQLSDKAHHVLNDAKETTAKVAHDVQAKGVEVSKTMSHHLEHAKDKAQDAKAAKQWWQSAEHSAEKHVNDMKKSAQETGEHAKHWWQSAERDAEKHAKELKRSVQETGENARDWFQDKGQHMYREARNYGRDDDFERSFDRLKNKTRQGWSDARDDFESRGRTVQKNMDDARDQGQRVRDRFHEAQDRLHNFHDQGQGWTREWANERRHDIESAERGLGDRFEDVKRDFKKFGRDAREYGEDRFRDARRDIRNRADDVKDHGRRQLNRFEQEVDRAGSWGHGRREGDDRDQRGWDRGNFGSSRYEQYDNEPRRSVTEAAKEGRYWWPHKDAADPYESYDRHSPPSGGSWWKGSSSTPQTKEKMSDDFDRATRQVKRHAEDLRDRAEDRIENGRSWMEDKTHQMKDRFEHGTRDVQNKLGELTAHGYREEQGRDFGSRFGATHNHSSIYSDDYWFHSDHSADAPRVGRRGGDRGL